MIPILSILSLCVFTGVSWPVEHRSDNNIINQIGRGFGQIGQGLGEIGQGMTAGLGQMGDNIGKMVNQARKAILITPLQARNAIVAVKFQLKGVNVPKVLIITSLKVVENNIFDETVRERVMATVGSTGTPLTDIADIKINGDKKAADRFLRDLQTLQIGGRHNFPRLSMMLFLEDKLLNLLIANNAIRNDKNETIHRFNSAGPDEWPMDTKTSLPFMDKMNEMMEKIGRGVRQSLGKLMDSIRYVVDLAVDKLILTPLTSAAKSIILHSMNVLNDMVSTAFREYGVNYTEILIKTSLKAVEYGMFDENLQQDILATLNIPNNNGTRLTNTSGIQVNGYKDVADKFIDQLHMVIVAQENGFPDLVMSIFTETALLDLLAANSLTNADYVKAIQELCGYNTELAE